MNRATGHYFDARTLHAEPVEISFDESHLHVLRAGHDAALVAIADLRVSDRLGDVPRFLYLPDEASIETPDNDVIDAVLARRGRGRVNAIVHWLEQRARVAAVATVLLAASVVAAVMFGLPVAARKLALSVPVEIERQAGRVALGTLSGLLAPSQLSALERRRVIALTERLVATQGLPENPTLEFRSMGKHANAFALPGGIIVVSDALVQLATDDELSAVLAHEIGHWQARHGLQGVLQGSAALLVVTAVTGDLSTLTTFAGTIPFTLLQRGYSRTFEVEADEFALAALKRAKIDARHLASILDKLEKTREGGRGDYSYLSTHPSTKERVRRIDPSGTFAQFAREAATFALAEVDDPPRAVAQAAPEMPFTQRALRAEGDVVLEFVIDESGRVRDPKIVRSPHSDFDAATLGVVTKWSFLPGHHRGRKIATRTEATLQFRLDRDTTIVSAVKNIERDVAGPAAPDQPPRLISSVPPEFPLALRATGVSGNVTVEFIVDPQGRVIDSRAVNSTHTAFEAPALAALRQWQFDPGRKGGRPVTTRVQQVIMFNFDDAATPSAEEDVTEDEAKTEPSATPPSVAALLAQHRRPAIILQIAPVHPPGLAGAEADVTVDFSVDREGRVIDARVFRTTNPNFDSAALAAVRNWRFARQAPGVDARIVAAMRYEVHFRRDPAHPVATEQPTSAY